MKTIFLFVSFSCSIMSSMGQDFGFRVGVTTATPTGNYDAYDFNFIESFSPKYKIGVLGNFRLTYIITLKPEISHRVYTIRQKEDNVFELEQTHGTISADLNFDIKLPKPWSVVFGMGIDYLVYTQHRISFNDSDLLYNNYNFNGFVNDQSLDPFANIGLCYKIGETILLDLEYRHLLDNWGVGELNDVNEFISSDNRSVKIHMINFSGAILF